MDFAKNAGVYDRRHGAALPPDLARALAAEALIGHGARVLDIGAGTGRVALALEREGCAVVALDPARLMLRQLLRKSNGRSVRVVAGEGGRLPFAAASFDAVVIARVLYLVPDWPEALREVTRVSRLDGRLLHEWGNGGASDAWVQIREKARALFEDAGVRNPFHPGARSEDDVEQCLGELGWQLASRVATDADQRMTLSTFLDRIAAGECSYIWSVPEDVQRRCLPELNAWAAGRFDLNASFPAQVMWHVYARQQPADQPAR